MPNRIPDYATRSILDQRNAFNKAWREANPEKVLSYRVTAAVNLLNREGYAVLDPDGNPVRSKWDKLIEGR